MTSARAAGRDGAAATNEAFFNDVGMDSPTREVMAPRTGEAAGRRSADDLFDVVSHMHHEIRTPLNAVIGFADLMQREMFGALGDARYREYAHHILDCGSRLLRVTEQTLAMAALAADSRETGVETLHLALLVHQAVASRGSDLLEQAPPIDIDVADDLLIRADGAATRLALETLVAGAMAAAAPGATLAITSAVDHGRISLRFRLIGSTLRRANAGYGSDIAVARALLRLQRIDLIETGCTSADWSVEIRFEEARQAQLL